MAIKDLNNKKTGDKLYASEWNGVMNEILGHFNNERIHQDMIITPNDELIYTDKNNIRHQYLLHSKSSEYGVPELNVTLNSNLSNAIDVENKLKSSGGSLIFDVICTQQHGSDTLYITEGITANVQDSYGNILVTSYQKIDDYGRITIEIPRNDNIQDISYTIFEINVTANDQSATWIPEYDYIQNKVIISYSNPNTVTLNYDNYPQSGNSTGILPTYSYKVNRNYDNGKSSDLNILFNQNDLVPDGINLLFEKIYGDADFDNYTGRVTINVQNTEYSSKEIAKVKLTISDGNDSSADQITTVLQLGLIRPSLIYGQIPISDNSELQSLVVNNQYPTFITAHAQNISQMNTKSQENFDGNITLDQTNSISAFYFLIKDNTKKLYWVDNQNAHSEITTYSSYNAASYPYYITNYEYLDNYYKLYILPRPAQNQVTMRMYIANNAKG